MESKEPEKKDRDENGRLLPGCTTQNPEGRNGHVEGYQPYGIRALKFLEMTEDAIAALAADKVERGKLPYIDAVIIRHLAATIADGKEARRERKDLLDRIEGQPVAVVDTTVRGKSANGLTDTIIDFIDSLGHAKRSGSASPAEVVQPSAPGTDNT